MAPVAGPTPPRTNGASQLAGWALGALAGAGAVAAWGFGPAVGAIGTLLAAVGSGIWWSHARTQARLAAAARDQLDERVRRLERRAYQLDEAEHLIDVGSFDWFPDSGELHWSEQHYRMWGYEPGSVVPDFELFQRHLHADDKVRVSAQLQDALQGKSRYDCTHRVQRGDGSVRYVRARGEVFFNEAGQAVRMIGAVLDVTERVQTESSLRVFEFVLDAITDTVSAVDTGMNYRLANAAWYDLTGVKRKHAGRIHFDHVFPLVSSVERRAALAGCLEAGLARTVRGHNPVEQQSGRIFETRYFPFRDPAVPWQGAVMISRDVTEDEAVRAELAGSVDNLRLTLNTIGDAIFATDAGSPDEPVLFANDQVLALWNIQLAEGQALTARVIVEHARRYFRDPDAEVARIEAIIAANEAADDRLALNDGRVLLRRCRATPRHPRTVRVWAFRDVTAEARALRSLAEAEERQRTLLTAFPGFIWVLDQDHRVVHLNPAAAEVYRPLVPTPGMAAEALFGTQVFRRVQSAVDRALAGETLAMEWQRPSQSGRSPEHMLIRMVPGRDADGRALCYAFGVDITSLKQAQADLLMAKDEAERANRAKTQFLSSMSHELRTPLNAVIGFGQVLEQNSEGNLSARQLRHVGEIRRAGSHLLALINDLLDLARIEAGRTELDLQPVPLAGLFDECVQLVQPLAQRAGHELLAPTPAAAVVVLADRMRLKQVLLNLLSNAIKYSREGGRVTLQCKADADQVLIEVIDQGQGLSPDAQARLFKPFERLGAEGSEIEGTGIGLALSHHLMQLMQGEIGVRSTAGQGSCFWLRLRLVDEPSTSTAAGPCARLLYIDDNVVNLALMEGLFEDHPRLQLRTSSNPQQALASLQQQPVDAVLVDLQMPELDGFEVQACLRADPATRQLPLVAVSADATAATRERCLQLGFVDLVTKPIDATRLFAAVSLALPSVKAGLAEAATSDAPPST